MRFKAGVNIAGLKPECLLGMILADKVFRGGLVVTSVSEGEHMVGSKHYVGQGFDVRLMPTCRFNGSEALKAELEPLGFDVVLETSHIHCEYDPK